jgi:pimeloyl-ACP methyl ester carboxylesterase
VQIHYKHLRGGSGGAVVLMHGFGGGAFSWAPVLERLAARPEAERPAAVAFDRPGCGLSSRMAQGAWQSNPYTAEFQARLVLRLMDELAMPRAVLVAHGSAVGPAVVAALQAPGRVAGLLLVAPAVFSEGVPNLVKALLRTRLGKGIVEQLVRTEIGEIALRRAWFRPAAIPPHTLAQYKQALRVRAWHEAVAEMVRAPQPALPPLLPRLLCPVLIVHGAHDRLIDLSESQRLAQTLGNADLVVVAEAGHVPHEEAPREVTAHLAEFVGRVFAPARAPP